MYGECIDIKTFISFSSISEIYLIATFLFVIKSKPKYTLAYVPDPKISE